MVAEQQCVLLFADSPSESPLPGMLRRKGMEVDTTLSQDDALQKLKAKHYSLLLLDFVLIEPDSLAFLKQYKQGAHQSSLVVILLTAAIHDMKPRLDPDLVHAVVRKPTNLASLADIVRDCTTLLGERKRLRE